MANEGLRPYWFDSSIIGRDKEYFKLLFYYPAQINKIGILDRVKNESTTITVEPVAGLKYTWQIIRGEGLLRKGKYNKGNTVIYDTLQTKRLYSNRISKR